ncbi:MAG TPA: hypothetical protein VM639_01515 [Dongiaceae bacterium]|nr:hypothetical protein [Dongiaceae bacterium]
MLKSVWLHCGLSSVRRPSIHLAVITLVLALLQFSVDMTSGPASGVALSRALAISQAEAATSLPAIDAALAAQMSDKAHKDWNPDAELIQIIATTTDDGTADASVSVPVSFFFRVDGKGYQITLSRYGEILGAPAPLPPTAVEAVPVQFISLKDALALARAKGFSQTGPLHPVLQSLTSTDGLQKIGWLFAAPGDPLTKQIFVSAEGHQIGSVQQLFGSVRQ